MQTAGAPRSFRRVVGALALSALSAAGCKSEAAPGDACKPTDIRCLDPKTELICEGGKFVAAPCKGPKGCFETQDRLFCDFTGNATGDPCALAEEGNGQCLADGKSWIVCRGGKYRIEPCRGEKGCHKNAGALACDQSRAVAGDACTGATNACATDGKQVLSCAEGVFKASATCTGEGGCRIEAGSISCDMKTKSER